MNLIQFAELEVEQRKQELAAVQCAPHASQADRDRSAFANHNLYKAQQRLDAIRYLHREAVIAHFDGRIVYDNQSHPTQ